MLTKAQILNLPHNTILHHIKAKNADGTPLRVRISGKPRTWKTRPDEWCLPVKYAFNHSFYITQQDADQWAQATQAAQATSHTR